MTFMKLANNTYRHPFGAPKSKTAIFRLFTAFLILTLLIGPLPRAFAADDTVLGLELDTVSQPIALTVDDGSYTLKAWATISGTSSKKEVSDLATWTSSSSLIKVSKGVITATGTVSSATITAKYQGFVATVSVTADYLYKELKLKQITSGGSTEAPSALDIQLGNELKLSAIAVDYDASEDTVTNVATWSSSNTSVATVSAGVVTIVSAGKATIIAKHKGLTDTITLTVTSPYTSISINSTLITNKSVEIYIGEGTANLTATAVVTADGSILDVTSAATWSSSNSNVVKVTGGVLTAVGLGSAIVTVSRYGVSSSISVYIRSEYEVLKLLPEKALALTLYGAPIELTATVSKGTLTPENITAVAEWKVADEHVASIEKRTDNKFYVVPKATGTTTVSATYKGLTKTQSITVFPTIASIDIADDSKDVFIEESGTLPAVSGVTVAGATQDVSKLTEWTSSDESIVKIEDGKWKALKLGTVTLTAKVTNEPNLPSAVKTDTITIVVHNKVLALDTESKTLSVVIGKDVSLPSVTLIYENGEEEDISDKISWKTSSANLLLKAPKMRGLIASTVTLTGTYLGKTITVKVTIEEEFVSFDIQPSSIQLTLKKSKSIKVVATTKSGAKVNITNRLNWTASAQDVVTVKGANVTSIAEGSGKLTSTIQSKTITVPYTVTAKLTKLTASDKTLKLTTGATDTVDLTATFENGTTVDVTSEAEWTTSNKKVATVSNGKIVVVGKGTAIIKAKFGEKTVSINVNSK
ncbi:MAG: hypothetical protein P0Y55_05830 [Candidatus Cohnella colombiensis]|uniref:BIG2 domain-containing protein n=1 Tax=Candidatus Cohnella colombiensis TaxID=3121368 RepID=A0AA95JBL9_9BACL|nr:MAG: hypothetical protein P0Y55_05830 [Cohnella sp.]